MKSVDLEVATLVHTCVMERLVYWEIRYSRPLALFALGCFILSQSLYYNDSTHTIGRVLLYIFFAIGIPLGLRATWREAMQTAHREHIEAMRRTQIEALAKEPALLPEELFQYVQTQWLRPGTKFCGALVHGVDQAHVDRGFFWGCQVQRVWIHFDDKLEWRIDAMHDRCLKVVSGCVRIYPLEQATQDTAQSWQYQHVCDASDAHELFIMSQSGSIWGAKSITIPFGEPLTYMTVTADGHFSATPACVIQNKLCYLNVWLSLSDMMLQSRLGHILIHVHALHALSAELVDLIWQYAVDASCYDSHVSCCDDHTDSLLTVCEHDAQIHNNDANVAREKRIIIYKHAYPAQQAPCPCLIRTIRTAIADCDALELSQPSTPLLPMSENTAHHQSARKSKKKSKKTKKTSETSL